MTLFSDDVIILDGDGENTTTQPTPQPETPTNAGSSSVFCQAGPSHLPEETTPEVNNLDTLLSLFSSRLTVKQIQSLYRYSGDNFDNAIECLMNGPSLDSILRMINTRSMDDPVVKVAVDSDDVWADMLAVYKQSDGLIGKRIRVTLDNSPVIDTCGVRKHIYTSVFAEFVSNKHVRLFDGPPNSVRPCYSAEARCFKFLGTMVGHSILQDGIGFPYLSPVAYWYMVAGEEKALEYVNMTDVGRDTTYAVTKVRLNVDNNTVIDDLYYIYVAA